MKLNQIIPMGLLVTFFLYLASESVDIIKPEQFHIPHQDFTASANLLNNSFTIVGTVSLYPGTLNIQVSDSIKVNDFAKVVI